MLPTGTTTDPLPQPASQDKRLYVFLHGLFGIVDHPDGLEVLMPHVPEHSYRAGPFMGETHLRPRPHGNPYILKVPAGQAQFDTKSHLAVSKRAADTNIGPSEFHARITMPLPHHIHYIGKVDLSSLVQDDQNLLISKVAALLIVLEYKFSDPAEISLEGHRYIAQCDPADGNSASLHFFSEEDATQPSGHRSMGFTAVTNLFPDLRGNVSLTNGTAQPAPINYSDVLPGTIFAEYIRLRDRTEGVLTMLGSSLRAGNFPSMHYSYGVGSDVESCTPLVSTFR
jgi:hypothetical protein